MELVEQQFLADFESRGKLRWAQELGWLSKVGQGRVSESNLFLQIPSQGFVVVLLVLQLIVSLQLKIKSFGIKIMYKNDHDLNHPGGYSLTSIEGFGWCFKQARLRRFRLSRSFPFLFNNLTVTGLDLVGFYKLSAFFVGTFVVICKINT